MSQIVYVEFEKSKYKTVVDCEKWLRQGQEYDSLLNSKKWKLKTVARSVFISPEPRAVYRWNSATLPYVKSVITCRPEPGVFIMKNNTNEFFEDTDLPARSREFQMKIREQEFARALKDQKRLDKEEERRQKKKKRYRSEPISNATELEKPVKVSRSTFKNSNKKQKKSSSSKAAKVSDDLPPFEMTEAEMASVSAASQNAQVL